MVNPLFNDKELSYLEDTDFLLTKQEIGRTIVQVLGTAENLLKEEINSFGQLLPKQALSKVGKISRGENYQGLPYWVLDFPRLFQKENVFAFRTMVWWGHEISTTLHVAGSFLSTHQDKLEKELSQDIQGLFFCVNNNPWRYEFSEDNYQLLSRITERQVKSQIEEHQFLKLSFKHPISEIASLPNFASNSFKRLMKLLI